MSEEEKAELEEEKAKEEKRNVAKQLATSFPKFILNGLIAIALGLFYLFIVPLFQPVLDLYPILVIYTLVPTPGFIVLTGYSLIAIGVLLVILLFGIEAIMQFAKSADAFAEFVISFSSFGFILVFVTSSETGTKSVNTPFGGFLDRFG